MARKHQLTPLGAVLRGALASAIGTAAMDALWYYGYRKGGGTTAPLEYEFGGENDWDKVSAPGKVAKRVVEALTGRQLPAKYARATNNVVHWGYGILWGGLYGILAGSLRHPHPLLGLPFAAAVWCSDYVLLPPTGVYKPMRDYDASTLLKDLSAPRLRVGFGPEF